MDGSLCVSPPPHICLSLPLHISVCLSFLEGCRVVSYTFAELPQKHKSTRLLLPFSNTRKPCLIFPLHGLFLALPPSRSPVTHSDKQPRNLSTSCSHKEKSRSQPTKPITPTPSYLSSASPLLSIPRPLPPTHTLHMLAPQWSLSCGPHASQAQREE